MDSLYIHDEAILFYFQALQRPWLVPVMKALSFVGETPAMTVLTLVLAGLFAWARRPRTACCLLVCSLLAWGTFLSIKHFVHRPRPDMAWRAPDVPLPSSSSFPSGHAFMSMAVVGGSAMLAARGLRRRWVQEVLVLGGIGFSLCVGVSRLYLGLHYPVDALTGWSGGLAYALLAVWADQRWGYQPDEAVPAAALPANAPVPQRGRDGIVSGERTDIAQGISPRS
jgi:undecaprenyl-diphosphatase